MEFSGVSLLAQGWLWEYTQGAPPRFVLTPDGTWFFTSLFYTCPFPPVCIDHPVPRIRRPGMLRPDPIRIWDSKASFHLHLRLTLFRWMNFQGLECMERWVHRTQSLLIFTSCLLSVNLKEHFQSGPVIRMMLDSFPAGWTAWKPTWRHWKNSIQSWGRRQLHWGMPRWVSFLLWYHLETPL